MIKATRERVASWWMRHQSKLSRVEGDPVLLFVHGLAGSPKSTWRPITSIIQNDADFQLLSYDCFSYPTSLMRLPLGKRMAGIGELSNGLKTHIEIKHKDKKVILVGHSLGGLIARHYILDQVKTDEIRNILGVMFIATPHTGASLANLGKTFSFGHRHLKQLCKGSDLLDIINHDWVRLGVERKIPTMYVVGGADKVVSKDSASPHIGASNVQTLISFGHGDIIEPQNAADIRYGSVKQFVNSVTLQKHSAASSIGSFGNHSDSRAHQRSNVLFDRYNPGCDSYYVLRKHDELLQAIGQSSNIWISGASGFGKTASLCRLIHKSGWDMHHAFLDVYPSRCADGLIGAICSSLCEKASYSTDGIPKATDLSVLLPYFQRAMDRISVKKPFAILVEEIPLPPGPEYSRFLNYIYQLTEMTETNGMSGRFIWLFSSINDPSPDIDPKNKKFRERIELIKLSEWNTIEITKLIRLICRELKINLSDEEFEMLISHPKLSPRFVKALFRANRLEANSHKSMFELIQSIEQNV